MAARKNPWKRLLRYEWRYHNFILLGISVILAWHLLYSKTIISFAHNLGQMGYLGALFVGMMFSYGITTPISIAFIIIMAASMDPVAVSLIASLGAVASDYVIFRFVRDSLSKDIKFLIKDLHIHMPHIHKPAHWKKFVPILAGFIIASPLPDELASVLFGAVHFKTGKFLLYSYVFNIIGIFTIAYTSSAV